jgi:hypothetical protein
MMPSPTIHDQNRALRQSEWQQQNEILRSFAVDQHGRKCFIFDRQKQLYNIYLLREILLLALPAQYIWPCWLPAASSGDRRRLQEPRRDRGGTEHDQRAGEEHRAKARPARDQAQRGSRHP